MMKSLSNESAALSLFTRIPIGTNQTRFPVLSALPVAGFVTGDTGLKTTSEVNWANKFINVEELAVIVPIPEAVLDDVSYDIWGTTKPLMEQAVGRALDAAILFGTNKPATWPTAIVTDAIAQAKAVNRGVKTQAQGGLAGDISAAFALVEASGYDVTGIIANRSWKGFLRDVRDTTGQKVADISGDSIYGAPVKYPLRGQWPVGAGSAEAIFGDFSEGVIGVRQDFTYKILDQAVIQDNTGAIQFNLAQQDMVAMRLVFRVGFAIANVLNYDDSSGTRYPFGVVRTP